MTMDTSREHRCLIIHIQQSLRGMYYIMNASFPFTGSDQMFVATNKNIYTSNIFTSNKALENCYIY